MRLFKYLVVLGILAIGYAYMVGQQHPVTPRVDWITVRNHSGLQVRFPAKPHYSKHTRRLPDMPAAQIHTYELQQADELYALLIMPDLPHSIREAAQANLQPISQALNDTQGLSVEHVRHLKLGKYPALEYEAVQQNGNRLWCRSVLLGNSLLSQIYGRRAGYKANSNRQRFFKSLRL